MATFSLSDLLNGTKRLFTSSNLQGKRSDGTYEDLITNDGGILKVVGVIEVKRAVEQLTQANAVGGVLTFSNTIDTIEIYNTDTTNMGIFTINGIDIHVPANSSFEAAIGGTPSANITVSGATSYIVTRYV